MSLINRVGQQRDGTGALDGLGQLTLMLCAGAGHTAGHDLAALVDITAQTIHVLLVDISDLVYAEIAYLAAGFTAARTLFSFATIFRHGASSYYNSVNHQNGNSSSSTCTKPLLCGAAGAAACGRGAGASPPSLRGDRNSTSSAVTSSLARVLPSLPV